MSSRLIVKNLPKYLTEERFKEHFGKKGTVTDVKLAKTASGRSRCFGYIGYKTTEDAQAARKYFNNTFIDTAKIVVEDAKKVGDNTLPRAWSVHSVGSSAHFKRYGARVEEKEAEAAALKAKQETEEAEKKARREKLLKELLQADENEKVNEKLKEYLEVMKPRSKAKTWANDDAIGVAPSKKKKNGKSEQEESAMPAKASESDDEYEDLPSMKKVTEQTTETQEAPAGEARLAHDEAVSDLDYLKAKMSTSKSLLLDDEEEADEDTTMERENNEADAQLSSEPFIHPSRLNTEIAAKGNVASQPVEKDTSSAPPMNEPPIHPSRTNPEPEQDPISAIAETGRLYLRNLPFSTTEDELREAFQQFGPLSEVHMPIDKETKSPIGYAFVLFLIPEHAVKAYKAMDRTIFQGRSLHVLPAKEKPQAATPAPEEGGLSFKKQNIKKKKDASGNESIWNSLYMNQDAIVSSIAAKLNISKADILDPSADNAAVRLALAETQIIAETKKYFEEHGIQMNVSGKKRSDTVILVKNIPFGTTTEDLRELFGGHGDLGRLLVTPAQTLAVVEFLHSTEGRSAYKRLQFSRFKSTLLYLEKAPVGFFTEAYDPSKASVTTTCTATVTPVTNEKASTEPAKDGVTTKSTLFAPTSSSHNDNSEDPLTPVAGGTLYVKNLKFTTTNEGLRALFSSLAGFRSAKVSTKANPRDPTGPRQSMGFGFLEFDSSANASTAMNALQGVELDGHKLLLKVSSRGSGGDTEKKGAERKTDAKSTKLIVRNVPFEATKKDLRELFGAYGNLKSLRLPTKFTGGHRGFAFLDFMTAREALHAMENVGAAHLYGRHLVIEYAKEGEDVEAIRERTGKRFVREGQEVGGNKLKRTKVLADEDGGGFDDSIE